ncbi:MAG: homocysteine methyltransferase [Clostridiales bacterium]|nr:homocysteine methyltransferase [Clostridiales bacterium]
MNLIEKLHNSILYLDGGTGTLLQERGLKIGELPEEWNLTHSEEIRAIHRAYYEAGADVVCANTFGANQFKLGDRVEELVFAAVSNAKAVAKEFNNKFVALDIGSLGKMLKPLGDLAFEDAVNAFKRTIYAGVSAGVDLILIETMNDIYELKAAVIAAKEGCNLPIFATCVFGEDQKTMTGSSPEAVVALLEGLGVDALGLNCSLAPEKMLPIVKRMVKCSSTPIIVKPNAGLPTIVDGKTTFDISSKKFGEDMQKIALEGATVLGGCCGTTPQYIAELINKTKQISYKKISKKGLCVLSSYTHTVELGNAPVLIGERINPTGKKRLKEAIKSGDILYILNEAVSQEERGAHVLDVNLGLPEIDEVSVLTDTICEIQAVSNLPLQIDTSNAKAMERALRYYNGKPLINSVNGKRESMDAVFPLVKKYGGVVVCLTLDEGGIPATFEGRIEIAKRIIAEAEKYGIEKCDLVFDTLAMAVSADCTAARVAIESLHYLRHSMGVNTCLGVSNISFGLPNRDFINSTFFAAALNAGLSAAIINPNSEEMIKTYKSYCALFGYDKSCLEYIKYAQSKTVDIKSQSAQSATAPSAENTLEYCIVKGLKEGALHSTEALLKNTSPLDIINQKIVPALNTVGEGFEEKRLFLPQLLMSAEAAAAAFEVIKSKFPEGANSKKAKIVIATVKGDIHDIGKNIVKALLLNYGFEVIDLGKDVEPEAVVQRAKAVGAHIVGLSALMTTTVANMESTVKLLRKECPQVKIMVGGAVLTKDYALQICADEYCKDAMESVKYCNYIDSTL